MVASSAVSSPSSSSGPLIPDYVGANLCNVVPSLVLRDHSPVPDWFPNPLRQSTGPVVLLVIDGLGWHQFQRHCSLMPCLASFAGGPISTVAPSTTAAALTSLATGATPLDHGIVGYRMRMGNDIMNTLRWHSGTSDLRQKYPPAAVQPIPSFAGATVPVVSRAELEGSAFTEAHLRGSKPCGWRSASSLVVQVTQLIGAGENFVYAYYDGVDKIAHERGFGEYYESELQLTDYLIASLIDGLPSGSTIAVVADHGQVHVGQNIVELPKIVTSNIDAQSGEGRFRWLHARPGRETELLSVCNEQFASKAWVVSREQVVDERWLGPAVEGLRRDSAIRRLGDTALVPFEPVTFHDSLDSGPYELVCRHGSLTADEMHIPFLAHTV